MVEIIQVARTIAATGITADGVRYVSHSPYIQIHHVRRDVHGNSIAIKVYGEMKIAAGEIVFARELKLNTVQVILLTSEPPSYNGHGYIAQKHIFHKGQYDNYASIDVFDDTGAWQSAGQGREDGSIWLDFEALGE